MKKRLLILAAMVIAMATLVGCGKEKSPEEKLAEELKSAFSETGKTNEEETGIDPQALRDGYSYKDGVLTLYSDGSGYEFRKRNDDSVKDVKEIHITGSIETLDYFGYYENLERVYIEKDLERIYRKSFSDCTKIESLVLPDSITIIDDEAFSRCTSLKKINMPKSLTYIGQNAFYGCSSLENVTFPDSLSSIGEGAFARCTSLTKVCIPKNVYVSKDGFLCCSSVTELILEDGMRGIGSSFMDATFGGLAITEVTIPGSVETIGDRAFCYTNTLETVVIKDGVKKIGKDAFIVCPLLTSVTIPASVEFIYENPFGGGSEDFTIYGVAGSAAETCANTYGYRFVAQ